MKRLFTALQYAIQTQFASHLAVMVDWSSYILAHGELFVTTTLVMLQPGWYSCILCVTMTLLTLQQGWYSYILCVTMTLLTLQQGWYSWELGGTMTLLPPQPASRYFHVRHHRVSDQYICIVV